jgi:aubergine-like protein
MMVVGFDVYHASTDGRRGQAVGAIVASTSRHLTQYFSAVSYHSDNEELSANLLVDFQKCLMAYRGINSKLPDRIMFYRDGVGQGQLSLVFEQELTRLRECIATAYQADGRDPPTLTFVVVSKRINTRIFELKGPARGDNPPPGTVVDDVITLPERYDFFIVAQSVRQGTVSPTSYNVLSDNSGLGADKIQLLTYKMCHMYYNWSGTVAVPSPVQYAHKLAFLTGTALGDSAHGNLSNLLYFL